MSAEATTTPAPSSASSAGLPLRLVIDRRESDVNVMFDRFLSWGASVPPEQGYHTYDVYEQETYDVSLDRVVCAACRVRRQPGRVQLLPERCGDLRPVPLDCAADVVRRAHPRHDRDHGGMPQRILDRRRREGSRRAAHRRPRSGRAIDDRLGGRAVVEVRGRGPPSRLSSPELYTAAATTPTPRSAASGSRSSSADCVEQGESSGDHDHVDVGATDELGEHRRLVHAGADRPDHALVAQLDERVHAGGRGGVPVVVGVVQVGDVEPVGPEPGERCLRPSGGSRPG